MAWGPCHSNSNSLDAGKKSAQLSGVSRRQWKALTEEGRADLTVQASSSYMGFPVFLGACLKVSVHRTAGTLASTLAIRPRVISETQSESSPGRRSPPHNVAASHHATGLFFPLDGLGSREMQRRVCSQFSGVLYYLLNRNDMCVRAAACGPATATVNREALHQKLDKLLTIQAAQELAYRHPHQRRHRIAVGQADQRLSLASSCFLVGPCYGKQNQYPELCIQET